MAHGSVEKETVWVKSQRRADRRLGDRQSRVPGPRAQSPHTRFVAQDITLNRLLEAELQEKNRRLGEANVELSQRNRELDEFVYVVSHDLQEPLRTLISFSDFLMKDYGDRLENDGQGVCAVSRRCVAADACHDPRAAQSFSRRQGDR